MKKFFFLCTPVLFFLGSNAQSFAWAKRAGLWAYDLGYGIGTDNAGNVYVSGKYEMSNAVFGNTTVGCAGNHDIFTAKYDTYGNFKWVRTAGGAGGDYAHCIAVDGEGNSYVSGEFEMTTNFNGTYITTNGSNDVFLAKYNTNGNLVWVRKVGGGSSSDKGLGVCIQGTNVYITGNFKGTANFGGTYITSTGANDIFIIKYTTSGAFQWVRKAGSSGDDEGYAVAADASGNCYVTGYFTGTANFSGQYISSYGSRDIFIAKYNSNGSIIWVKKAGGSATDHGDGITIDKNNRIFLTGGFRVKSYFGPFSMTAQGGDTDIFTACYDANGNPIWVRKAGGAVNDCGRGIACDKNSNLYITGNFGATATFGTYALTGIDNEEIFFASYDANGNFRWALKAGGVYDQAPTGAYIEMGLSIATDPTNNVVGAGTYRASSKFGNITLSPYYNTDIYLTKIVQTQARKDISYPVISPCDSVSFCNGGSVTLKVQQDSGTTYTWLKDGAPFRNAHDAALKTNVPGEYAVMAINGNDTMISSNTKVLMTKKIIATLEGNSTIMCKDSNSVLKAVEGEGNIYRWNLNGNPIRGATNSSYQPLESGNYQVKIIQGSCFEWSPVIHVDVKECPDPEALQRSKNNTGNHEDSLQVNIYPNPNNGLFTIDLNLTEAPKYIKEVKVEVINTIGQIIYSQTISCSTENLSHHVELGETVIPGVYFLQIAMGDKVEKTRMILTR